MCLIQDKKRAMKSGFSRSCIKFNSVPGRMEYADKELVLENDVSVFCGEDSLNYDK